MTEPNDSEATPVELAVMECVNAMDLDDLLSYANESMIEFYTTHATPEDTKQLLEDFGPDGDGMTLDKVFGGGDNGKS